MHIQPSLHKHRWLACLLSMLVNTVSAETAEGLAAQAMDLSVDPCQDFYQYACGGWIASQGVPQDEPSLVRGFSLAEEDVRFRVGNILQQAANAYPSADANTNRLGAFFRSCMATEQSNDISALQPYLTSIDLVSNADQFLKVAGQLHSVGVNRLFDFVIAPDSRAGNYTLLLFSGNPSYRDGDVYYKNDAFSQAVRKVQADYIVDVLVKLGASPEAAQQYRQDILAIETVLARYHRTYGSFRGNLRRVFFPGDLSAFNADVAWEEFFLGLSQNPFATFYVAPEFLQELGPVLAQMSPGSLRAYLRWALITDLRAYAPAEFRRSIANEAIYHMSPRPRARICIDTASDLLGDAVGLALMQSDDSVGRVPSARKLFRAVRKEFINSLGKVDWLPPEDVQATRIKTDALLTRFGFPGNEWQDYSALANLSPSDFLANIMTIRRFNYPAEISRYGQAVSRKDWYLSELKPQDVNAANSNSHNKIYLLAGILRPPFLDLTAPVPVNYAGIGQVAAHELMHGVDDIGRRFQADGSIADLWSEAGNQAFDARSACVREQYGRYRVDGNVRVKSGKTLEENLSDVNGLKLSFRAFQRTLKDQPASYRLGSLTASPQQFFFISYAQTYCSVSRPGVEAYLTSRSWWRYAPPKYRALGPLVDRPQFVKAFGCPAGTPMNRPKKCQVW